MRRTNLLNLWFTVIWFVILAFLFYIQTVKYNHFRGLALIQHKKRIELLPKRGDLYDASGRLIATSAHCYSAYVLPKYIKHKRRAAKILSEANFGSFPELIKKFNEKNFFWLKRKFDQDEKEKIEKFNIFGVFIESDMKRIYPFGDLFSSMVGKVNADNQGIEGLEYELNDILKGKKGCLLYTSDAADE